MKITVKGKYSATIEATEGTNLLEILKQHFPIENPCLGHGTCGKCRVLLSGEELPLSSQERKHQLNGMHLACELYPSKDIVVTIPELHASIDSLSFHAKIHGEASYAACLDIGTTTLQMILVDVANSRIIAGKSALNPQYTHGLDVFTRLSAIEEQGLFSLQKPLIIQIETMLNSLLEQVHLSQETVSELIVVGNPTMLHILLLEDTSQLGYFPYSPSFVNARSVHSEKIGLDFPKYLYTLPMVSAFIGADTMGGILSTNLARTDQNTLLVDIGTNGEVVLATSGKLIATSCAAGPALEGMNISSGMRAQNGAIEDIGLEQGKCFVKTINEEKPIGICGSGLLATLRELLKERVIGINGRFAKTGHNYSSYLVKINGKHAFQLADNVFLTQKDIREAQLSKMAILSAIQILLKVGGLEAYDIDEVIISGQFGSHLSESMLLRTGFLPEAFTDKIVYAGNTALKGAYLAIDSTHRTFIEKISRKIEFIELSTFPDYETYYINAARFPEESK